MNRKEIGIPQKQVGSSIMPGKINPVIPEFVISVAHKIYANDVLITALCGAGCLELNAYLPVIGCAMIESLKLLIAAGHTLKDNLFEGLVINSKTSAEKLFSSPSITTALIPFIGYNKASLLAREMKGTGLNVFQANDKLQLLDDQKMKTLLSPDNLLKLGYTLNELID